MYYQNCYNNNQCGCHHQNCHCCMNQGQGCLQPQALVAPKKVCVTQQVTPVPQPVVCPIECRRVNRYMYYPVYYPQYEQTYVNVPYHQPF